MIVPSRQVKVPPLDPRREQCPGAVVGVEFRLVEGFVDPVAEAEHRGGVVVDGHPGPAAAALELAGGRGMRENIGSMNWVTRHRYWPSWLRRARRPSRTRSAGSRCAGAASLVICAPVDFCLVDSLSKSRCSQEMCEESISPSRPWDQLVRWTQREAL